MRSVDMTSLQSSWLRTYFGSFIFIAFLLGCFPCAGFSQEADQAALVVPATMKTMSRTEDFVVIHGSMLKSNLEQSIERMALLACINGKIQPIPFQIDEISSEGEWILPNYPPYLKKPKKHIETDEDQGLLDENDELVFMIRDSGDRIQDESYPEDALSVDEIMLKDPYDDGRSWVYLCSYESTPPRSEKDYVDYIFPKNRVVSDNFEVGFSLEVPISWDYLSFRGGENMVDRFKLRVDINFFGIKFHFDETDWKSELSLYKDGPVRVIRRVRSSIYLTKRLRTPSAASESIYYDNAIVVPFRVKVPISPAVFGKFMSISTAISLDMQNMHGWRVKTDVDPRWMKIDGKMDRLEKNIVSADALWYVLVGPQKCMLQRYILDKGPDGSPQVLPLETELIYVDDDATPDPPEFVPGQSPRIGYMGTGLGRLRKGTFYLYDFYHMINYEYVDGMETSYLRIVDQPLQAVID